MFYESLLVGIFTYNIIAEIVLIHTFFRLRIEYNLLLLLLQNLSICPIFSDVFLTFLPQAKYTERPLKMYPSTQPLSPLN